MTVCGTGGIRKGFLEEIIAELSLKRRKISLGKEWWGKGRWAIQDKGNVC